MKKENLAYKIIGRFFASIFTVLFVLMLIVSMIYTSMRSMLTVKNVTKIVTTTMTEVVYESEESVVAQLMETVKETELGAVMKNEEQAKEIEKTISDIMNTNACQKTLELYIDDAVGALSGLDDAERFTAENVESILDKHSHEIVAVITEKNPNASAEEIEKKLDSVIDTELPKVIENMPAPKEIITKLELPVEQTYVQAFFSTTFAIVLWAIVAVLALLIFLCRLYRFKALKWIGIGALIASIPLIIIGSMISIGGLSEKISNAILVSVVGVFSGDLLKGGIIMAVCGVAFIVAAIAVHYDYKNKEKLASIEAEGALKSEVNSELQVSAAEETEERSLEESTEEAKTEIQAEDFSAVQE